MYKEYTANGQRIVLSVDPSSVAVRFREPAPRSMRATVAHESDVGPFPLRYEIPEEKYTILPVSSAAPSESAVADRLTALNARSEVARAAPVYRLADSQLVATDRVLVGFHPDAPGGKAVLKARGLEILDQNGNEYVVRLGEYEDPFEVSEQLTKEAGVEYAEPDFVVIGRRTPLPDGGGPAKPTPPGDPLAGQQYALEITRANEAWKVQPGNVGVRIAILDEGVDVLHADLREAIKGSYDATDDDEYQDPLPGDAHGTACAGLAAAVGNNGIGVRGIGAGCSLLAIRIAYGSGGTWVTTSDWVARAVDWAWRNGASVLSNSWGGGAPSTKITKAFERARQEGRSGKGCVIVLAAGNHNGPITYPATIPNVMVVAASNEFDEPKTPTSGDGETWWGSAFGAEVRIAAPGVHNYTTDISGSNGYNDQPGTAGDYVPNFNGTSSATPIVAGAAGLVLSANPSLTESEVRAILEATADKVGSVTYVSGRNDRMGFGRVNVLRAVKAAQESGGGPSGANVVAASVGGGSYSTPGIPARA